VKSMSVWFSDPFQWFQIWMLPAPPCSWSTMRTARSRAPAGVSIIPDFQPLKVRRWMMTAPW